VLKSRNVFSLSEDNIFSRYSLDHCIQFFYSHYYYYCSALSFIFHVQFNGEDPHSSRLTSSSSSHSSSQQVSQSQQLPTNLSQQASYDFPLVHASATEVPAQRQVMHCIFIKFKKSVKDCVA
jgi:hypothetical protein